MPIRDVVVIGCGALHSAWVSSAICTALKVSQVIASIVVLPHEQIEDTDSQRSAPSGRRLLTSNRNRVGGALGFRLS